MGSIHQETTPSTTFPGTLAGFHNTYEPVNEKWTGVGGGVGEEGKGRGLWRMVTHLISITQAHTL